MSLLSAILLPQLEKQLVELEPQVAEFILGQLKNIGGELVSYVEGKLAAQPQVAPAAPAVEAPAQ